MIVARLFPKTDEDGRRYLLGQLTVDYRFARGTRVILRKTPNGTFELMELAPRERRTVDPKCVAAFHVGDEEVAEPEE